MSERPALLQINLSPTLGGAEVWMADFTRALGERGWRCRAITSAAPFWAHLDLGSAERLIVEHPDAVAELAAKPSIAVVHAPIPRRALDALTARARLVGVAHQAIYAGRWPSYYAAADTLLSVSRHVTATLSAAGFARIHPEPLLGVAEVKRLQAEGPLLRGPLCEWDRRKLRDRAYAGLERLRNRTRPQAYERRPGLVLGIVSRLAPLKQFPALFAILAPLIAAQRDVFLEVFGAAIGHRALRELRAALAPLGDRVRLWGHQTNVAAAYRALDWLLTGLPEREALGLNVIESCSLGTPVLAVDAPPFTETMVDGATGFLYADPRGDQGRDFARVLNGVRDGSLRVDPSRAADHLVRFSFPAFAERADAAMRAVVGDSGASATRSGAAAANAGSALHLSR